MSSSDISPTASIQSRLRDKSLNRQHNLSRGQEDWARLGFTISTFSLGEKVKLNSQLAGSGVAGRVASGLPFPQQMCTVTGSELSRAGARGVRPRPHRKIPHDERFNNRALCCRNDVTPAPACAFSADRARTAQRLQVCGPSFSRNLRQTT